jgi:hypothetical protein
MAVVDGVPFQNLWMKPATPAWKKAVQPVLDFPSATAEHARAAWESMGVAEPSPLDEWPGNESYRAARTVGKNLLGGFNFLMSPVTGAFETLWNKPASIALQAEAGVPKKYADPIALYGSMAFPGVGFGVQLGQLAAKTPKTISTVQKTLRELKKDKPPSYDVAAARTKAQEHIGADVSEEVVETNKLFTLRKDGSLGPLFIGAKERIPVGEWVQFDEKLSRKGFATRPGIHAPTADAPHIKPKVGEGRIEKKVLLRNWEILQRPQSQGGNWYIAGEMKVLPEAGPKIEGLQPTMKERLWNTEAKDVTKIVKTNPGYSSDLLDLSSLGQSPQTRYGAPGHFSLERKNLSPKNEELWDEIFTPEHYRRTIKHIDLGLKEGGFQWWDLEPLRYSFIEKLGPDLGNSSFLDFVQITGALSPGSQVPLNIRRAAYFYHLLSASKNPAQAMLKWEQGVPKGLGHYMPATHLKGLERVYSDPMNQGLLSVKGSKESPKASSMSWNLMGNWGVPTVDVHIMDMMTGTGYHKFDPRKGKLTGRSPEATMYAAPEQALIDISRKKGVLPGQAQAAAWGSWRKRERGLGESEPFLILFERIVKDTAQKLGKTPERVLDDWIKGKIPLASVLPMGATQLGTDLADDIFGEKLIG